MFPSLFSRNCNRCKTGSRMAQFESPGDDIFKFDTKMKSPKVQLADVVFQSARSICKGRVKCFRLFFSFRRFPVIITTGFHHAVFVCAPHAMSLSRSDLCPYGCGFFYINLDAMPMLQRHTRQVMQRYKRHFEVHLPPSPFPVHATYWDASNLQTPFSTSTSTEAVVVSRFAAFGFSPAASPSKPPPTPASGATLTTAETCC